MREFAMSIFNSREVIGKQAFMLVNPFIFIATLVSTIVLPTMWYNPSVRLLVAALLALPLVLFFVLLVFYH